MVCDITNLNAVDDFNLALAANKMEPVYGIRESTEGGEQQINLGMLLNFCNYLSLQ